jgi:hypothetical protein
MAEISFEQETKVYPDGTEAVHEVDLGIGDRVINDVDAKNRELAMAFQHYALHPRTSAVHGRPLTLQVDTRPLHFFDPATGQAIA